MKRMLIVMILIGAMAAVSTAQAKGTPLKTEKQKVSYSIGANIGQNFKMQNIDIDVEILIRGLKDALAGKTAMKEDEMNACMQKFQTDMMNKQQAEAKKAGEGNRKLGAEFMAANKNKEGVKTTASGLQYKVLKMGTGAKPSATSTVTVHYRGTTIDGKEFDSSYKRGEPTTFPLNQVVRGWTEGVQLMPVGSKFEFYIPADLGYGDRAMGANIPAGSTLIFEIELIEIK